jgi:hypothetical protein
MSPMSRSAIVVGVLLLMLTSTACLAMTFQGRGHGHHAGVRTGIVFVGGYYYDPFFGPYPWWPPVAYPGPYVPIYDDRAEVRVLVTPNAAAVYADGFYAGIVDDFNGFFERLPLPPGEHEVVLFLDGYRTARQMIYLQPASTFKLRLTMERLRPGERSEPPPLAPMVPPPPVGTYRPPRTAPPFSPPEDRTAASHESSYGTLALRVQPAGCGVWIDGEPWASSDGEHLAVRLTIGRHRIEVGRRGYQRFATDIEVRAAETTPLNVSLSPDRLQGGR